MTVQEAGVSKNRVQNEILDKASRWHIVRVNAKGYHRAHSFSATTLEEAAAEAIKPEWRSRSSATILRDGSTGRRYCIRDLLALLNLSPWS